MTITLEKNKPITLTKANPGIRKALVGLGWNPRTTAGVTFDLDASAFVLKNDGTAMDLKDVVFYSNLTHASGAVQHKGDNRNGQGDGDDEQILIDLDKVPANVDRIVFVVSIDDAVARQQRFGQVDGAYFRVVNEDTGAEVVKFDLREDADREHSILLGELFREQGGAWQVIARTQGFQEGLAGALTEFGIALVG